MHTCMHKSMHGMPAWHACVQAYIRYSAILYAIYYLTLNCYLHHITLPYIALLYNTLPYLRYVPIHYITLPYITSHHTRLHCMALPYHSTVQNSTVRYNFSHKISLISFYMTYLNRHIREKHMSSTSIKTFHEKDRYPESGIEKILNVPLRYDTKAYMVSGLFLTRRLLEAMGPPPSLRGPAALLQGLAGFRQAILDAPWKQDIPKLNIVEPMWDMELL